MGHTRLRVIDPREIAAQPMRSSCGRFVLAFNGEIYNFLELKGTLPLSRRRSLRTASDTEVLLELLADRGLAALSDVDGMYAFVLYDRKSRNLTLCRDPFGEKPLYYSAGQVQGEGVFAAASEIGCFAVLDWVDRSIRPESVYDFLAFMYTAPPHTLFSGIKELPPGSAIQFDLQERWLSGPWKVLDVLDDLLQGQRESPSTQADCLERVAEQLRHSVSMRLRSDVPLGVLLSGGLDSNVLASLASAEADEIGGNRISSFTMDYRLLDPAVGRNEPKLASRAAAAYGLDHAVIEMTAMDDLDCLAARALEIFSGPFGNFTALATDRLSSVAARSVTVALVGDGGDELFAGYPRHRALQLHAQFPALGRALRFLFSGLGPGLLRRRDSAWFRRGSQFAAAAGAPPAEAYLDWLTYLNPTQLSRLCGDDVESLHRSSLVQTFDELHGATEDFSLAAMGVDLASFVPNNLMQSGDRASMRNSLELRSPFLNRALLRTAASVPSSIRVPMFGRSKPMLRENQGFRLYPPVRKGPKVAFNPPLASMLRRNRGRVEDALLGGGPGLLSEFATRSGTEEHLDAFYRMGQDVSTLIWGLFLLSSWRASDLA
jgi:asparagine synthase (glutamine-hydrolysing)